MGGGAAAFTAANDDEPVQVSGQAAPQPVLCRGDLCVYRGVEELSPDALDAVLAALGGCGPSAVPPDRYDREWWKQGVGGWFFHPGPHHLPGIPQLPGPPPSPDYSPPPSDVDDDESAVG
ncbi:hypothetical protein CYMTET_47449 [Cymbomonas tetramitiformis]|uniref:Uncharacterized protein n=1 Tax=Cymbomonas tetramitiformis TaxID=36881 RepID=A0AAE0EVZ4_9CHLO|nr:hypothetical protein CYMTET_47449 [Cymbomonas tetramitiformis]